MRHKVPKVISKTSFFCFKTSTILCISRSLEVLLFIGGRLSFPNSVVGTPQHKGISSGPAAFLAFVLLCNLVQLFRGEDRKRMASILLLAMRYSSPHRSSSTSAHPFFQAALFAALIRPLRVHLALFISLWVALLLPLALRAIRLHCMHRLLASTMFIGLSVHRR